MAEVAQSRVSPELSPTRPFDGCSLTSRRVREESAVILPQSPQGINESSGCLYLTQYVNADLYSRFITDAEH